MASYESDDWVNGGDAFLRKVPLYKFPDLPFNEKTIYSCCSYGGPIAIGIIATSKNMWHISIYKSNGICIANITTEDVLFIQWTKDQKLIVMNSEGRVVLFSALGELLDRFDMGEVFLVEKAQVFSCDKDTGLIVINKCNEISGINSVKNRALWRILGKDDSWEKLQITCCAAIYKPTEPTNVIVCSRSNIFCGIASGRFSQHECDWTFKKGSYTSISPNADYSMIALMHDSGYVQIVSATLDSVINLVQLSICSSLRWCGNDLVFIQKTSNELEFGLIKSNDKIEMTFSHPICVGVDNDSLRVFSCNSCYLVSLVPLSIVEALNCLSRGATALLYDACKKLFNKGPPTSDTFMYIKMIGDNMPQAVTYCLDAAANHTSPLIQMNLLRAANVGMSFCDSFNRSYLVDVQKKLRVLNTLRRFGFPITYPQIQELGIHEIISRLLALREWSLAIELCKFMEIKDDYGVYMVLRQWYRYAICRCKERMDKAGKNSMQEEEVLAKKILNCMKSYPRANYSEIAAFAVRKELRLLAYLLLEHETDLMRRVNVLFKLNNNKKALETAIQSQQPDLLHMVLDHICKKGDALSTELELLLNNNPQALVLYQSHMHESAPDKLLALYKKNDDIMRQSIHYLNSAEDMSVNFDISKMIERLESAKNALSRDGALNQLIDQSIQLITENGKLEERYACVMTDKSLRETFIFVVSKGEMSLAESLRKHHKLNDKQYWLWTIEGFAKSKNWNQLEQFCSTKKCPLGYVPLIDICYRYGNEKLAQRFLDKIAVYEDRIRGKTLMKDFLGAARLAASRGDMTTLQILRRQQPPTNDTWAAITQIMQSIEN